MQVQQAITAKLTSTFSPIECIIENESHMHNVAKGSETHFKVICVSDAFEGLLPVKRHQAVYSCLSEELDGPVHALSLHLFTPAQWAKNSRSFESPQCMGGSKK